MASEGGLAFGPFRFHPTSLRLLRGDAPVTMTPQQAQVLRVLVSRPGEVISRDALLSAAWDGAIVTDNSIDKAVSRLRQILDARAPTRYIETVARTGYRFAAPVSRVEAERAEADLDAVLAPHRAWIDGRAMLETLAPEGIAAARARFEALVGTHGQDARFHVGLAKACVLQYEATRAEKTPDHGALERAAEHAQRACRLNPDSAEAWATLGFVLERTGARDEALAALDCATTIEPSNWRHHLRLAWATWGGRRLQAAERTLTLLPGCAPAHWLTATVYVARDSLTLAEREVDAGLTALPDENAPPAGFPIVGLHWLKGLLCLARGAGELAEDHFRRELALEPRGHLYARECSAHAWYAIGACRLRQGDRAEARKAFDQALTRVPSHAMARAGLSILEARVARGGVLEAQQERAPASESVDAALARAAALVASGDVTGAAQLVHGALSVAPPGNAGWTLPIDPLLGIAHDRAVWTGVLRMLGRRAM